MTKNISAKSISESIGTLIAKLCYPVADEMGKSLQDKVGDWRKKNTLSILEKADKKVSTNQDKQVPPRIMHQIIEEGSWCDDDAIKEMWAGILASSYTENSNDDSNLLFINTLKNLTLPGLVILKYACENSEKYKTGAGLIGAYYFKLELDFLLELTKIDDIHRLDRELDHLRALELIQGGIHNGATYAVIALNSLALQLYVKGHGYLDSPLQFFDVTRSYDKWRDQKFINQWVQS